MMQKMVDEVAKAMGYITKAYHGTSGNWTEFNPQRIGSVQRQDFGKGIYLAPESRKADAEMYARQSSEATGEPAKVLNLWVKTGKELEGANYAEEGSNLTGAAKARNRDSVIVKYDKGEGKIGKVSEIIVLSPDQIKSADPVTYDNAGNVIPLSERFNPKSNDIRFQPDPASPNILNGSDGSRIIKSTSGKYRVYLATGALAGVKDSLESAQKLVQSKSK
jgi:hypothetical protein